MKKTNWINALAGVSTLAALMALCVGGFVAHKSLGWLAVSVSCFILAFLLAEEKQ